MASKTPPSDLFSRWLSAQRWFAAKSRRIASLGYDDVVPLRAGGILIVSAGLDDGARHRYAVPISGDCAADMADAMHDADVRRELLRLIAEGARVRSDGGGELHGHPTSAFPHDLGRDPSSRIIGGEQSNTSIVFAERLILKFFRLLTGGIHPEREIPQFLTERTPFKNTPRLAGHLEYRGPDGQEATLAVMQEFVADGRDGWKWMLDQLSALYARAPERGPEGGRPSGVELHAAGAGPSLAALRRLGDVTAQLHRALASDPSEPAFAPEPVAPADITAWARAIRRQLEAACEVLGDRTLLGEVPDVTDGLSGLRDRQKIRHHGDLHLGQTLYREASGDFLIIDFEGEPLRPLAERRQKHSALRDVAGMLRSIDYAATFAPGGGESVQAWADAWAVAAADEFLTGYRRGAAEAPFLPTGPTAFARAVAVFELEKAAYEVVYEANHRPRWIDIPRRGLLRVAARLRPSPAAGAA